MNESMNYEAHFALQYLSGLKNSITYILPLFVDLAIDHIFSESTIFHTSLTYIKNITYQKATIATKIYF